MPAFPSKCLSPSVLLPLLADVPGKAASNGPSIWVPITHVGDLIEFLGSGFWLIQPWLLQLLRKLISRCKILSLHYSLSVFQINEYLKTTTM